LVPAADALRPRPLRGVVPRFSPTLRPRDRRA